MRISVIAVVVIGLFAGVARAQPAPDKVAAQAAFNEGQQRFAAGEYLPAAVKFEAAYTFDPDPVYLFNVAQAYRLGNACSKAVSYYHRFLEAVPNPPNLANVKQYIEQSEACAASSGSTTTAPTDPVVVNPPIAAIPPPADPGRTKRWLGIGGMFVGGAALGLGIYYTTEASRITDERLASKQACTIAVPCDPGYADAIDARGSRAELRARISYTVGGVALIGGVALYLLGRSSESASVAVVPTTGGAVAVGAFTF